MFQSLWICTLKSTEFPDHFVWIGLVERLIETIKNILACFKEDKSANNSFHVKYALKIFIHQLRICTLIVFSTKPKLSNLSYENIVNHYIDGDTVTPEEIQPDEKGIKV